MKERGELVGVQASYGGCFCCSHGRPEISDERGTICRCGAEDLAPVRTAGANHKSLSFKAIYQSSDSWGALEELFRHREGGQSSIAGIRQDAQHVVLLERDSPYP